MQGRQACNRCEFGSLVLYTMTFLCESCFIIGVTGSPPLLCAWLRADQGGAVPGWEDPRPGPGAVHTKVTSGHGARLQLCHMPGRSPGEHPLPNPLLHWPLSEGRRGRHPRKPTGRRTGRWAGEGIALWPSVPALLTWRCRLLVSCREGLGAREPWGVRLHQALSGTAHSYLMSIFWETGSYCSHLTQEEIQPPKNSPCSRLHSRSDQHKIQTQFKKKKFAFFYYHKKSVWEDLGTPELQGKVSTQFPLLLLNLLKWGEILQEIA